MKSDRTKKKFVSLVFSVLMITSVFAAFVPLMVATAEQLGLEKTDLAGGEAEKGFEPEKGSRSSSYDEKEYETLSTSTPYSKTGDSREEEYVVFNTGSGTYPSISGEHKGKFTLKTA